jgi:glycosyltransferase involved in cell wall biosynthesis
VAVVHSYYSSLHPSGENAQVDAEVAALQRAGVDARTFPARTDDLEAEPLYRLRAAARVATGRGRTPLTDLGAFGPDVVHVHNLFPNYSRRWVDALDVPLVATLHNFRTVCAGGNLFRDGQLCTDCPDGRPWSAVRHRCYRGSLAATAPVAIAQRRGPGADPVLAKADRILCLSPRQRRMLAERGVAPDRLTAWSNFLPDALAPAPPARTSETHGPTALYVGRMTSEKGCLDMVNSWPATTSLHVVGDGPQASEVRAAASKLDAVITPHMARADVLSLMQRSGALVMPSGCPEGLPLVFLEALACGLPIVVRRECDVAEHVEQAGLGTVVDNVDDMAAAATEVATEGRQDTAARCRRVFEEQYTEHRWAARAIELYTSLTGAPASSSVNRGR